MFRLVIFGLAPAVARDFEGEGMNFQEYWTQFHGLAELEVGSVDAQRNFEVNLKKIQEHNRQGHSWQMGLNPYSHLSDAQFRARYLMAPQQNCSATSGSESTFGMARLPANVDWRQANVISEVKNQGECGSCWTFSTVGALEAHHAIRAGTVNSPRLSEQQLLDCAGDYDNNGCDGGLPSHAFEYIANAGGLDTEFVYPYLAEVGQCRFHPDPERSPHSQGVGVRIQGSVNITAGDEQRVKEVLATRGPVSVTFHVADDFRHYASGVYTRKNCPNGPEDVNHAVLAVGYGREAGLDYMLVKNSWDYTFGEAGFFKIQMGTNMCGLAQCNAYPDFGPQDLDFQGRTSL